MIQVITQSIPKVEALCPVFNQCGGCLYQDIDYADELKIKRDELKAMFRAQLPEVKCEVSQIVASPKPYHYRNRLDLKCVRSKEKGIFIGFTPQEGRGIIEIDACYIAQEAISDFIPDLKKQVKAKLPAKYNRANIVVRSGDDERLFWGGIGRRSNRLKKEDYFFTTINNKKIFYSLDTFFQANLSILPQLIEIIRKMKIWSSRPTFWDLYGGVGLFGLSLADLASKTILIEDNPASIECARHNCSFNNVVNFDIIEGTVEQHFYPEDLENSNANIVFIDPPRAGLSETVRSRLTQERSIDHLLYLSCHPESLIRDLQYFLDDAWEIKSVIPFDFFPKTKHLETLIVLEPK